MVLDMELKNSIYKGHVLDILKDMKDESVDCIVTSPPYWALRDYNTEGQIWDGNPDCEHEWNIKKDKLHNGRGDAQQSKKYSEQEPISDIIIESSFCQKCGAWKGSLGLEPTFQLYIKHLCDIFDEIKRVLKKTGTCWVNLGDTYGGSGNASGHTEDTKNLGYTTSQMGASKGNQKTTKGMEKSLCQIPSRFAIEMTNRGWLLRNELIWHKPNCMPSSVKDRFTVDFEKLFFFTKSKKYYFEQQLEPTIEPYSEKRAKRPKTSKMKADYITGKAGNFTYNKLRPQGRNKRAVWNINTKPFKEAHFAVFPEKLIETPIRAGCPQFICKKCDKIREKVYELGALVSSYEGQPMANKPRSNPANRLIKQNLPKDEYGALPKREKKEIGLTDCGCNAGFKAGIVLDPFFGAGTTGMVALKQNKKYIGIELNEEYIKIAEKRLRLYKMQQKLV